MKNLVLPALFLAAMASVASADYTVNFGAGPFVFVGGGSGGTITTPAMTGSITGIIFSFDYSDSANASWAADMAGTVDGSQFGGYDLFLNGATNYEGATGAANSGADTSFTSGTLTFGSAMNLVGQSVVVGFGNGYSGGDCTLANVYITLVGTVPTPGAAALLGLGGLVTTRRRR